ncbi:hypothetical protein ALC56_04601 [Trachymyrmex septentrionalis]|uniref:Uncharacterized protein n=1 Tax=Trachymyrmex septentrionalis TaxID=34720 RepID=A0A195FKR3_9HYME|nr:hypothetical protein ALC56_04601 [Trachymyrmex septentrionalis]
MNNVKHIALQDLVYGRRREDARLTERKLFRRSRTRFCSRSQPTTSDRYRAPAGRPAGFNTLILPAKDLPAQVSFRLISRLDDFLEQNPIDFTTKH